VGSETFYCIRCGIRVIGLDARGERSHCPACLPAEPAPPAASRESSKRIRRPSSGALIAVAVRPRAAPIVRPRRSRAALVGGLSLAAVVVALAPLLSPKAGPTSTVIVAPPREAKPLPLSIPPEPEKPRLPPPAGVDPVLETLAAEIEEAAAALADEGRFEDALSRFRAFPADARQTRAGARLDGLKRQIEARARSK
jgi:hypothetical protein